MEIKELYSEFPNLLYRLQNLPQDEKTKQLEHDLRDGLSRLDGLLQEIQLIISERGEIARKIKGGREGK